MTRQFDVVVEKDSDGFFVAKDYGIGVSKYSAAAGKSLITALKRAGFLVQKLKGSRLFLRHPAGRTTDVPVHAAESIGPGL